MSMTLWCLSKNKQEDGDDFDHSIMFEVSDRLDEICVKFGVKKLSDFFDWTDYHENLDIDMDDELDSEPSWFLPAEALVTLTALKKAFEGGKSEYPDIIDDEVNENSEYLLEEIDDCINKLKAIEEEKDTFHFCVVS